MAKIPITSNVLKWAIRESGFEPGLVANAAEVDDALLEKWLEGAEQPTATQFHKLAKFLKRPEAVFFLPRPPESTPVAAEFRFPPGATRRGLLPEERLAVREAARLQRGLAAVVEALGEDGPDLPAHEISDDPEGVASQVRHRLAVPAAAQLEWASEYEAARRWREALERLGVHVLFLSMGEASVQGFSLWNELAPVIAVNTTKWRAQARIYTLFHELAHLLTRTSSLCAKGTSRPLTDGDKVERWCEQFAAAVLLPWPAVEQSLAQKFRWTAGTKSNELDRAAYIAAQFKVSLRASAVRLITRGAAGWELYKKLPPLSDVNTKSGGPPAEEGQGRRPEVRLRQYGLRTTRTLLRGVTREAISRDDALRFLDVADSDLDELQSLTVAS